MKYVTDPDNLKLMMILLKDSSRSIQFEAFHVFKASHCIFFQILSAPVILKLSSCLKTMLRKVKGAVDIIACVKVCIHLEIALIPPAAPSPIL